MQKRRVYDKIHSVKKTKIIDFIKGFLIGFSLMIPGVCSALVSIILNVYHVLLEVIGNFYRLKIIRKYIYFIIGILIGIICLIFSMAFLLKKYENILSFFFLGLAIEGFLNLLMLNKPRKKVDFGIIILGILLTIIPELLIVNSTNDGLYLIIIGGFLSSLAFIMPGISGSLILLILGIYPTIINCFSNIFSLSFNKEYAIILICFIISFLFGIIIFSKIINKVLKKYENQFLKFCLGLLIGSICLMIKNVLLIEYNMYIKILICLIGFISLRIFNKKGAF